VVIESKNIFGIPLKMSIEINGYIISKIEKIFTPLILFLRESNIKLTSKEGLSAGIPTKLQNKATKESFIYSFE
jgi:hypothetical protein